MEGSSRMVGAERSLRRSGCTNYLLGRRYVDIWWFGQYIGGNVMSKSASEHKYVGERRQKRESEKNTLLQTRTKRHFRLSSTVLIRLSLSQTASLYSVLVVLSCASY